MNASQRFWLAALLLCAANAWGQTAERQPHVGYLYPAGGQQGTVVQSIAGGQFLRGATDVYVSGEGVRASVVRSWPPPRALNRTQIVEIQSRLNELREKEPGGLSADLSSALPVGAESGWPGAIPAFSGANATPALRAKILAFAKSKAATVRGAVGALAQPNAPAAAAANAGAAAKSKATPSPPAGKAAPKPAATRDQQILDALATLSLRELEYLEGEFIPREMRQPNAQIAETALLEITIDPQAAPGERELRLMTPAGLTNPLRFEVGQPPEVCEQELIGRQATDVLRLDLPVTINGQIMPGDVDRFRFHARRGQRLVMETQARALMPYLADAVPGWFQATLALYDAKGKEVAFDDDYEFNPDPVVFYQVPEDGDYTLEIHDAIYRVREDFVYRVSVGELPFVASVYPLGGRAGAETVASLVGWNLPGDRLPLNTQPGGGRLRQTVLPQGKWVSNPVAYAVDSLPECEEAEPNDSEAKAQSVALPHIINGRIDRPGDVDVFQIDGRAGDEVVAEVYARRLNSPLDSVLRLNDASGRALMVNDDCEDKASGLLTHHADSYLSATLPRDGVYYVHLTDAQNHGDASYGYRLRLSAPRPDFELRVAPSSINTMAGLSAPISVYALRRDGFNGEIELAVTDAPAGFTLSGGRIPAGRNQVRMTLTAPPAPLGVPVAVRLVGRARIGGETIVRPAVPSEDMMQAFAYRHLAPFERLMVASVGKRWNSPIQLAGNQPVRVPAGGAAQVRFNTPNYQMPQTIQLELSDPPKGVTLQDVNVQPSGLAFALKADGKAAKAGLADNLIVQAYMEIQMKTASAGAAPQPPRRIGLGVLPAIPIEIVRQ
ncbi:MAG: PPC domain-containing protein [Candidatus Sumerlaeota bacterium]|nr:PPC domain-containing protein [Candidatus Sumerlaeota bacterium]